MTEDEARERLERAGSNELPPPLRANWPQRLGQQFAEPMALLLLVAAAVSGVWLGEALDAAAIVVIVVVNALIAVGQEGRAERALDSLRELESITARVRRDGTVREVNATDIVPGDLVLVGAGDRVPADLRLTSASALQVEEAVLTGESLPVDKVVVGQAGAEVDDEADRLWSGTLVTRGSG